MEFLKEKLQLRIYQQTILDSAVKQNILCVIPTGLGKTHVAIALASVLIKNPEDKILMLAPTKPLVNQHKKTFEEYFKTAKSELVAITGSTPTKKRAEIWSDANIIISTPQTIKHDILADRIDLKAVKLIVFDESHRATGGYAYTSIAKYYRKQNSAGKILGLTASPGTDKEKVNEICKNLFIEKIELRSKKHPEVMPFIKKLITKYEFVDLPPEFKKIKRYLELAIKERLIILKKMANRLNQTGMRR